MRTDEGPVSENSLKIVVMGVSGSGKSLVGAGIATALDATFVDSDALHPRENVAKMSRGDPLDDADRAPWLDRVGDRLGEAGDCVIACSALKRVYRDRIRAASGGPVIFVHLIGDQTLISERMAARVDHFMPPRLLASQFATLEVPDADEAAIAVDISPPVASVIANALDALGDAARLTDSK